MKVSDVVSAMENMAPSKYAMDWDNTGLLVGDGEAAVNRVLFCIDMTQKVLDEAIREKAQMVIAYHPVIFKGVKSVTAQSSPVLWAAMRSGMSVYCPHTALDVAKGGVNDSLADAVGMDLSEAEPLEFHEFGEKMKLIVFVPASERDKVCRAAFAAGAGIIGEYEQCSFAVAGEGSFLPGENANPTVGSCCRHETVPELRVEMIVPREKLDCVCRAIRSAHSYEEPAIDIYKLADEPGEFGMGRIGGLRKSTTLAAFVRRVKKRLGVKRVLLASGGDLNRMVTTVAVGAGSCGDMWKKAAGRADIFVTGEMRHHDALAAVEAGLCVICVGHGNSERHVLGLLAERLASKVHGIKMIISQADRDPLEIV
ncbi:MAG TPA: Nif3-like dinuclear metal center hexameric protein [Phycisphaerae bacterium]|nr:Nif3-like dinuclear metal center hexameric protein [Phycisphaerae bacterium]